MSPKPQPIPPIAPRRVEVLAFPDVQMLDVAGPVQVFADANAQANRPHAPPPYQIRVVAPEGVQIRATSGLAFLTEPLPDPGGPLDTLIVAGGQGVMRAAEDAGLVEWLKLRAGAARRTASVCTGAFLLAAAGLLDRRRAVTHWEYCDLLSRRHPAVTVEPDPIFVRDGLVWSSAGVTAGIDLEQLAAGMTLYDAFYRWARDASDETHDHIADELLQESRREPGSAGSAARPAGYSEGKVMWKIVIAALVLIVLAAAAFYRFALPGLSSARPAPPAIEVEVATWLLQHSVPAEAAGRANPLKPDEANIAEGAALFQQKCSVCHGFDGTGRTTIGEHVYPRAPSLRRALPALTDGQIFTYINDGIRNTAMPAWDLPENEIWRIVTFLRHLPPTAPPGARRWRAVGSRHRSPFRRLGRLPILSQGNLCPLAEDAHGQCRARSARAPRRLHPRHVEA